jgi:hypothetical protein
MCKLGGFLSTEPTGRFFTPFYDYRDGRLELTGPWINSSSFRLWCIARFGYRDARILEFFGNAWEIIRHPPCLANE